MAIEFCVLGGYTGVLSLLFGYLTRYAMTGPRSTHFELPQGLQVLRRATECKRPITDRLMLSIGIRVGLGPPKRLSAHDVIFKLGGYSNRYDMWTRLTKREDVADRIMEHCVNIAVDANGRQFTPMLDGLGVILVMNALRGDAARVFRNECEMEFMRYMNGATLDEACDELIDNATPMAITHATTNTIVPVSSNQQLVTSGNTNGAVLGNANSAVCGSDVAHRFTLLKECVEYATGLEQHAISSEMKAACNSSLRAMMEQLANPM